MIILIIEFLLIIFFTIYLGFKLLLSLFFFTFPFLLFAVCFCVFGRDVSHDAIHFGRTTGGKNSAMKKGEKEMKRVVKLKYYL